jgi:hypothetical protein
VAGGAGVWVVVGVVGGGGVVCGVVGVDTVSVAGTAVSGVAIAGHTHMAITAGHTTVVCTGST